MVPVAVQSIEYTITVLPETVRPKTAARTVSQGQNAFIPKAFGKGILRPFVRDGKGDFANSFELALVRSEIAQVLGTVASSGSTSGELPWRPEFGSILQHLRHRNLDEVTAELARTYVIDALSNWLRNISVTAADVVLDHDNTRLIITVRYDVLATGNRTVVAKNQTVSIALPTGS